MDQVFRIEKVFKVKESEPAIIEVEFVLVDKSKARMILSVFAAQELANKLTAATGRV